MRASLSKRLLGLAVAIAAAAATLGLSAATGRAATCDSWVNAAGGAWETGANWSTNAPPTSGQEACIEIALSAPVLLNSSPTVAGLTLGGSSGAAELEANGGRTLTLSGSSTIGDNGVLTNENGTLVIHQTDTLTNDGVIAVASSGLQVVGNLTNAADGMISSSSAYVYIDGPGTFTNEGELSLTGTSALVAPFNGGTGATVVNAGTIENTSSTHSTIGAGATLEETSGATTGTPVQINGGTLDLEGGGNSMYQLAGTSTLTGTVAAAQTIILDGNITTTGSLTNNGTLTGFQGPQLTVPSGSLTNNGLISLPGLNLTVTGNVHNTPSGRISISGGVFAIAGTNTLMNDGTIAVGSNGVLTTTGTTATIDNDGGTIQNAGQVTVSSSGGTFVEGDGAETGNLVALNAPQALQLTGSGASGFELNGGATISGNIAAGQIVQDGSMNATGSFTNSGTMFPRGGRLILPSGDTLTNDGLIAGAGGLTLDGSLTNAVGGVINMQQQVSLYGSNESITNNGTIYMPCCGGFHLDNESTTDNAFVNNGTFYIGTLPTGSSVSWGGGMPVGTSSVQAGNAGDDITMDGTVVPLPSGAEMPSPPLTPSSSWFNITSTPGTNPPPIWTLGCGFSVQQSNWAGSCSDAQGGRLTIASDTSLDPTITTVVGSGSCNGQHTCSSTYGQPVTITATVSQQYGPAPTGTVTLLADLVNQPNPDERVPYVLGTVPLSTTDGVTTGSVTTQLPPGQFQLSAIYNGDSSSLMSAAMFTTYVVQNIAQPTTAVQLAASSSPVFGAPVTLTATVTPSQTGGADPTGSVRFGVGASQFALGEAPVVTVNGVTTATLTTTALPAGASTVYAVYSGDYNYGASTLVSTPVTEAMPAAPTHVMVSGPSSIAAGTTYSATASTDGTGAVRYSLAANPAPPDGMTIDGAGNVTFPVPATGLAAFSYVVVVTNAAGRAHSAPASVTVTRTVTVSKLGAGSGTVTSGPAGINCGSTCSAHFAMGSSVTLTAAAAAGSRFAGWSGGGCSGVGTCSLTALSVDENVKATFVLVPPNTKLAAATIKPKQRTARFTFRAVGVATGFQCALARTGTPLVFQPCASPMRYQHLRAGTYTFKVRAMNGPVADRTPATRKFTISG
jgi:Bacterial Ig-like domain (group 3)/Divergent InlB B-repeat domain